MKLTSIVIALVICAPQAGCAQVHAHHSEKEVSQMTSEQRLREYCREFSGHGLLHRDYLSVLDDSLMRDGVKTLPVIVKIIDEFDPTSFRNAGRDREDSAYAAELVLSSLDAAYFRVRSLEEGRLAIDALRRAISRMRTARYDSASDEGEHSKRLRLQVAEGLLKELQGANNYDQAIRDTMELRYKITVNEKEMLDFADYLISKDPKYPRWSELDWYTDQNKINEAGNPAQYRIVQNIQPFYNAYKDFKLRAH